MDTKVEAIPGMMEDEVIDETPAEGQPPADTQPIDENPVEGQTEEEAAPAPVDEKPAYVVELERQLEEMRAEIKGKAGDQPKQPDQNQGPALYSDDWYKIAEKDFGFTTQKDEATGNDVTVLNQKTFLKGLMGLVNQVLTEARGYTDNTVHGNVADMRFETSIRALERSHPDIRKHEGEIKKFLESRYKKQDISNSEYIMDAYWREKGRTGSMGGAPQPKRNARVVAPAPGNRGGKPSGTVRALGPIARDMIASGQFKDEAEYRAWEKADLSKV